MSDRELYQRVQAIEGRLRDGDVSIGELKTSVHELKQAVSGLREDTSTIKDIVLAWNSVRGFVRTMQVINRVLWFIASLGAAVGAIYGAVKIGIGPSSK